MARVFTPLLAFGLIFGAWEIYARASGASPLILPGPSGVIAALIRERGVIAGHAMVTFGVAVLGFTLSTVFAFATSVLLHAKPLAERALMPVFVASQTIPLVALAPLMILWFGFGLVPKVILVVLVTFLPILMSLLAGYRQVPQAWIDLLTSMGASPQARFRRAVLPAARASFFAGLRISATYAVVATIFAEYAGSRRGLGIYILAAKNNFRADLVLAAVVVSACLTLSLLGALRLIAHLTHKGPEARHA